MFNAADVETTPAIGTEARPQPLVIPLDESWDISASPRPSAQQIVLIGASWILLAVFIAFPAVELAALSVTALVISAKDDDQPDA